MKNVFVTVAAIVASTSSFAAGGAPVEEAAVTLKVSQARLNGLPDNYVDDLCRAANVIWATASTKENSEAASIVCAVAMTRREAAGKTPSMPKPFPLSK